MPKKGKMDRKFDPEGSDYDYQSAVSAGDAPDETGHWGSVDPRNGMALKGRKHPTWDLFVKEEGRLGNQIVKDKKDGRYYTRPRLK